MPQIEYVTLAHHAEAVNGLLYLQGSGWSDLEQPIDGEGNLGMLHLGIGVSIIIGWNASAPISSTASRRRSAPRRKS